jgi:CheY-like chemotaxis protein
MKKKLRFLIADDDPDDRELLGAILQDIAPGAVITMVSDGTRAVDYLQHCGETSLPHVIILDYNMPLMSAPQVLDRICNKGMYAGIAKFIMSTSDSQQYLDGCRNKGVIEYFKKPNSIDGIRRIAIRILEYINTVSKKP